MYYYLDRDGGAHKTDTIDLCTIEMAFAVWKEDANGAYIVKSRDATPPRALSVDRDFRYFSLIKCAVEISNKVPFYLEDAGQVYGPFYKEDIDWDSYYLRTMHCDFTIWFRFGNNAKRIRYSADTDTISIDSEQSIDEEFLTVILSSKDVLNEG